MALQQRQILGESLCMPSSGDGACQETTPVNSWTGDQTGVTGGVKSSAPVPSRDQYDADTTSRLAGLERQHIQTSREASNYSAHLDGGSTGAGEAIGGTSGLSVDTGYGDNPTPSDDGGTGKVVG